ncbi:MAG TPA: RNA polymerase sigma factor [Solirubrobacteraceae bacterium]|jgi:RNA polymerase sigma-70 factor (ECF subfamily)
MAQARHFKTSDDELLALTAEDPRAFGLFYDRFEAEMLAFFWRATRRADLAADLSAEVFAQALASASGFRSELGSARAWLFGIARHELANTWERGRVENRARRRLGLEPLALSDEALERIDELGGRSCEGALRLLEDLPEDQRLAVQGRVLEEHDYEELAKRLSCSQSVVRQRVSRGLRSIRDRLEQTR